VADEVEGRATAAVSYMLDPIGGGCLSATFRQAASIVLLGWLSSDADATTPDPR
jgi:hypothetical protein